MKARTALAALVLGASSIAVAPTPAPAATTVKTAATAINPVQCFNMSDNRTIRVRQWYLGVPVNTAIWVYFDYCNNLHGADWVRMTHIRTVSIYGRGNCAPWQGKMRFVKVFLTFTGPGRVFRKTIYMDCHGNGYSHATKYYAKASSPRLFTSGHTDSTPPIVKMTAKAYFFMTLGGSPAKSTSMPLDW